MRGDHVQVALNNDGVVGGADRVAGLVKPVEHAALVKERGLRGVQVLR